MPVNDALGITPLKCPYCKIPMRLTCGNSGFSYWSCENCHKEFEFNIQTEQFTDEINSQLPLSGLPISLAGLSHFL